MRRLFLGLILLAAGLLLGAGDLLLAWWASHAGGEPDIQARGPWFLALSVPFFAAGALALLAVPAGLTGRRHGVRAPPLLAGALVAVVAVGALLYVDPTA